MGLRLCCNGVYLSLMVGVLVGFFLGRFLGLSGFL